jgi:hypothetical protein
MLFVSFYTPLYAEEAKGLIASLREQGAAFDVVALPSAGSWQANCAMKPAFISEMVRKHRVPVVWVDADARLLRSPDFLLGLDPQRTDFAAHWANIWRNGPELLSGTTWWGTSHRALNLLAMWEEIQRRSPEKWDQKCLQTAVEYCQRGAEVMVNGKTLDLPRGKQLVELPAEYCKIFDLMAECKNPVIEHHQASRRFKNVEQSGTDHPIRPLAPWNADSTSPSGNRRKI